MGRSSTPMPPSSAVALWITQPRTLEYRLEPLTAPGDGEVLVHAVVSALSHGTEMLVFRGEVPAMLELDLPTLRGSFGFPIKYGYASVGQVVEVGSGLSLGRPVPHVGQLVFVHHPHQTEYVVPAEMAIPLPAEVEPEIGVFAANLETAVNVLLDSGIRFGERLAIFGQGVVGLLITQLARRSGASSVIAVDPLRHRRDLALLFGADAALPPDPQLPSVLRELTDGIGPDIVIEVSGNSSALDQAIESVAFEGTVVVASWYGTKPITLALGGAFHRRRVRLVSSQVSSINPALQPRWSHARRMALVGDLLPKLDLAPLITHRIPFSQAQQAYRLVEAHPEETVQVILTYEEEGQCMRSE